MGYRRKVNSALDRIRTMSAGWTASKDRRAIFADAYGRMTEAMVDATTTTQFVDPEWVTRLLDTFAGYYFVAVDAHEDGSDQCPTAWSRAFDACALDDQHPLQVLFLGINAHINYDLVFALADVMEDWTDLDVARRSIRRADHEAVNVVIARTIDVVQEEVVSLWSPGMARLDVIAGRVDEWLFSRLIADWRSTVWDDAIRLLESPMSERGSVVDAVVARTERTARVVAAF